MSGVVDLLDGLLLMSLRVGHGMVYMTPLETCSDFPLHLVPGVDVRVSLAENVL